MTESEVRKIICKILEERNSYNVVVLKLSDNENIITDTFLEVFNDLDLSIVTETNKDLFYIPENILYISGANLFEIINIFSSDELRYKTIRDLAKEKIVFVDMIDDKSLNQYENKDNLLSIIKKLLKEININLLIYDKNINKYINSQTITGKRFITINDLKISGPGELIIDKDAKITMALSEKLSSKRIDVRRV